MTAARLEPHQLRRRSDPEQFRFETTAELPDLAEVLGQPRAIEAIRFGIGIRRPGYNLYVLGAPGTGRHAVVERFLREQAEREAEPSDWCYVNNFADPQKPKALRLPRGRGTALARDMQGLVEDLRAAIPAAFESEEYRTRHGEIEEQLKERHEQAFDELRREAEAHGVTLIHTPGGFAFAPVREGEVLDPAEFEKLPDAEKERIGATIATMQERLEHVVNQIPQWKRETRERIRDLDAQVAMAAVTHPMEQLKRIWAAHAEVLAYFDAVQRSVVENVDDFRRGDEAPEITLFGMPVGRAARAGASLRQYEVNVLIDHGATRGAPVVHEDNPTYSDLIGRVEHVAQMGALVTDFTLIKPGALHRANGGYLVLDARRVLLQPFAWEGLKRVLSSGRIRIESLGQALSLVSTVSIEPEPIPVDVKVVLIGEPLLYYLLQFYDPEFAELFKVAADFDDRMNREDAGNEQYARLIATFARRDGLLPFDRPAVARVVEQGARLADDAERLSLRTRDLTDLLQEADFWARQGGRSVVARADVQQAIEARVHRHDRLRSRVIEEIERGTILIDTAGATVGQVNGLSVAALGEFAFGHPSRITARVRLGRGELVDIEREVKLGGPIHSKGVLILGAFLGARYAAQRPLSLRASLVFEQSYGPVEGDSASCAELFALLSVLADAPIRQSLAVTGSVNQHGEVQPIGGVNEKIEGFFDVCHARGLSSEQGVLIPSANVKHLMLREDVVEACAQGKFHVYAVSTVDEGIEILTGMAAGVADAQGRYPEGSVNRRVEERLHAMAEAARAFAAPQAGEEKK